MKYCKKCVYPDITVKFHKIQDNNVYQVVKLITFKINKKRWEEKILDFEKIVNEIKSKNTGMITIV